VFLTISSDLLNSLLKKQTTDKHRCTRINKENNSLNKFRNLFQSLKFPVKKEKMTGIARLTAGRQENIREKSNL